MAWIRRGSVTRACLHCQSHAQRLQELVLAASSSGSRRSDPWALGPERGDPQYIHNRRTEGLPLLECRRPWARRVRAVLAKTAAFFPKGDGKTPLPGFFRAMASSQYRCFSFFHVATGLEPERNYPLHLLSWRASRQTGTGLPTRIRAEPEC